MGEHAENGSAENMQVHEAQDANHAANTPSRDNQASTENRKCTVSKSELIKMQVTLLTDSGGMSSHTGLYATT